MSADCIVILGGSFDPVHAGHIAIAEYFCHLFQTRILRLIPAGNPWQKPALHASATQRIDMLKLAFEANLLSVTIDRQETERTGPSYTIDTLRAIRAETGDRVSLVFILGADQLLNLNTWHQWKALFEFAHIAVASRPGFTLAPSTLPPEVYDLFFSRLADPGEIRNTPFGHTFLAESIDVDISASEIRKNAGHSDAYHPLVPAKVLDYIVKNNLYRD
ncbi:MAG: nicotinate-nucleotide adenylyltransferase [Oxalobacter sp.]|nr:nicotinate-nucleotide adenylyltransferase [Oxalobacter sp.]